MTPTNDDTRKHLRNCDKETRLAKLRALGRGTLSQDSTEFHGRFAFLESDSAFA